MYIEPIVEFEHPEADVDREAVRAKLAQSLKFFDDAIVIVRNTTDSRLRGYESQLLKARTQLTAIFSTLTARF